MGERVWRGVLGRQIAEERRLEMAEFIAQMRAAEAADEEAEYWKTHTWQRWKRDVKAFVVNHTRQNKKTIKERQEEARTMREEEERRLEEEEADAGDEDW